MIGEIYLGSDVNTLILITPLGRTLNISNKQISRSQRTASGLLTRDVIATKKEFVLSYNLIDGDDLDLLYYLYELNTELILRLYTDQELYTDYTVLMDPIDQERVLMFNNGLWANVDIKLIQV